MSSWHFIVDLHCVHLVQVLTHFAKWTQIYFWSVLKCFLLFLMCFVMQRSVTVKKLHLLFEDLCSVCEVTQEYLCELYERRLHFRVSVWAPWEMTSFQSIYLSSMRGDSEYLCVGGTLSEAPLMLCSFRYWDWHKNPSSHFMMAYCAHPPQHRMIFLEHACIFTEYWKKRWALILRGMGNV